MELLVQIARAVVAGVFLASAAGKVSGLEGADRAVVALAGVPARLARPAGLGLIAAETAIAALTVVTRTCVIGLLAAAALLTLFTVLILRVLGSADAAGESVHCACFGASSAQLGPVHVVRNVLLLVLAALGSAIGAGHGAAWAAGTAGAVALGAGLALAVTVALLDDLVFLFRTEN